MTISAQLNKASSFSFELIFPLIPVQTELRSNDEFVLNIYETVLPGVTLGVEDLRWQGGVIHAASGELTFEPWNVNFVVDSEFKNWQVMFKWLTFINNNKDKYIDEYTKYAVDATLKVIDNFQDHKFSLFFVDVWPNSLGEINMTYREGETILEAQTSFVYDRFEIREYSTI
jgi:hypothetical protein